MHSKNCGSLYSYQWSSNQEDSSTTRRSFLTVMLLVVACWLLAAGILLTHIAPPLLDRLSAPDMAAVLGGLSDYCDNAKKTLGTEYTCPGYTTLSCQIWCASCKQFDGQQFFCLAVPGPIHCWTCTNASNIHECQNVTSVLGCTEFGAGGNVAVCGWQKRPNNCSWRAALSECDCDSTIALVSTSPCPRTHCSAP